MRPVLGAGIATRPTEVSLHRATPRAEESRHRVQSVAIPE